MNFFLVVLLLNVLISAPAPSGFTMDNLEYSQLFYVGNVTVVTVDFSSEENVQVMEGEMYCDWVPRGSVYKSNEKDFAVESHQLFILTFDMKIPYETFLGEFNYTFKIKYVQNGEEKVWEGDPIAGGVFDYYVLHYTELETLVVSKLKARFESDMAVKYAEMATDELNKADKTPYTAEGVSHLRKALEYTEMAEEEDAKLRREATQRHERNRDLTITLIGSTVLIIAVVGLSSFLLKKRKAENAVKSKRKRKKRPRKK